MYKVTTRRFLAFWLGFNIIFIIHYRSSTPVLSTPTDIFAHNCGTSSRFICWEFYIRKKAPEIIIPY